MKNWLKEKLVNLLGLKHLCDEVEAEADRLCTNIDDEMHNKFEQAYSELQDQIETFNNMVEGYTITVKLNKE